MTTLKNAAFTLAIATLALLSSNADAVEPNTPTTPVLHRTVKIDGLDIFYREAGSSGT